MRSKKAPNELANSDVPAYMRSITPSDIDSISDNKYIYCVYRKIKRIYCQVHGVEDVEKKVISNFLEELINSGFLIANNTNKKTPKSISIYMRRQNLSIKGYLLIEKRLNNLLETLKIEAVKKEFQKITEQR